MDRKSLSANASSMIGKQSEKKDENFFTKTAHAIRDKVHGLTDEVKEKTHNLTHSSDSKKDKASKSKDSKSKTSSKSAAAAKKDSSSDSDDSPKKRSPVTSGAQKGRGGEATKRQNSASKSSSSPMVEKKNAVLRPGSSKSPSDKASSSKPSSDPKDAVAAPSSSGKSSGSNSTSKRSDSPLTNKKLNDTVDRGETTNKPSADEETTDQIHISFNGITTVDDLLDRIDEAIENAKLLIGGDASKAVFDIYGKASAPRPTRADLEKKPKEKSENENTTKVTNQGDAEKVDEEPIRINYNDMHKIEDLLAQVHQQPGSRKVVLENAPESPDGSVTVRKKNKVIFIAPSTPPAANAIDIPPTTNENDDPSAPPKSILKTSQDPSSLDTSTKTAALQDDQIHVNIEGARSLEDLLDRIDNAVQSAPIVIDTKPDGEKRQAPQAPNQQDNTTNSGEAQLSVTNPKREAPKAPSATNDKPIETTIVTDKKDETLQSNKKHEDADQVPSIKVPEHEFQMDNTNKQASSTSVEKKDEGQTNDWI